MSSIRKRTTWAAADRKASAPPAVPGYGSEDQDHPAHQPDPAHGAYAQGSPSEWAEDPHQPPYPEGNPPAVPGYDSEDQDHPAHQRPPRVPKEAQSLKALVQKKAAKCLIIANRMMGEGAGRQHVEAQALDMMDWSDSQIESTLQRLGIDATAGGFLADDFMDDDGFVDDAGPMACGEDPMAMDDGFLPEDGPMAMYAKLINAQKRELDAIKAKLADQNKHPGPTQGPGAQTEEQERSEADKLDNAETKAAAWFDKMSGAGVDGFSMKADWQGSEAVFAALDTDGDDILARDEVVAALIAPTKAQKARLAKVAGELPDFLKDKKDDKDEDKGKDDKDAKKKAKKSDEDEDEEPEGVEGGKKAKKSDEDEEPEADEEPEGVEGGKKAKKSDEDEEPEGDDEDEEAKLAASYFDTPDGDPMGLGGESVLTAADEQVLGEIFSEGLPGVQASGLPGSSDVEASMKPQPRQASSGVKTIGQMARTASQGHNDLSQLWDESPDVSDAFGM